MRYVITFLVLCNLSLSGQNIFQSGNGIVNFISEAPLEIIKAESNVLQGVVNIEENRFAFKIPMTSFQGFNSPLQKEHFNENYMESNQFPEAIFVGKIIEKDAFESFGEKTIRAKGMLTVHGIEQERIIKCKINYDGERIDVKSFFTIFLDDHEIKIPKIVYQKISEEIQVTIRTELSKTQ